MTLRRHILQSTAALMLAMSSPTAQASAEETRSVRVSVTVREDEHHALAGIVVGLAPDERTAPVAEAVTDHAGRAILEATVPESRSFIEIRHAFAQPSEASLEQQGAAFRRLKEVQHRFHLERVHRITLDPKRTEYDLAITAWPAIEVKAMIVDERGRPQSGAVMGPPHSLPGGSDRSRGRLADPLRGVRRGVPSLIAITSHVSRPAIMVRLVRLSAEETDADVDMGDVRIDSLTEGVPVNVRIAGHEDLKRSSSGMHGYLPGLTFVSPEGSRIISYRTADRSPGEDGLLFLEAPPRDGATLPAGAWYVAPGQFSYSDDQMDLIAALSSGRDPHGSDLLKIDVSREDPNDFVINVSEAHEGIRTFMSK